MDFGFGKNKDVDGIIISYLDIADYITLLKTNKNFKGLFVISDIIHKDKIFDFLKYLVNVKDFDYAINIIKEMQSNSDCISKYNFEDFADNHEIFSELIIMGDIENEELLYEFTEYYIFDYLCYLNETMGALYDIIMDEYPLNRFIKKLLYFDKSYLVKRAIESIISCFHDDGSMYKYYNHVFYEDKHFNSFVIARYIRIIPEVNWEKLGRHIYDAMLHSLNYRCKNKLNKKNYINEFLIAAVNLKSNELLDIIKSVLIRNGRPPNKVDKVIETRRKMISPCF